MFADEVPRCGVHPVNVEWHSNMPLQVAVAGIGMGGVADSVLVGTRDSRVTRIEIVVGE